MGSTKDKDRGSKADRSKDRGGKVETDHDRYDRAGKGKDPGNLKDIPTKSLERMMKHDTDAWRAGQARAELGRREQERRDYDRKREGKLESGSRPTKGGRWNR